MKKWITLAAAAALFASCSKQNLAEENMQSTAANEAKATNSAPAMRVVQGGAYVSDWEQYSVWDKTSEASSSKFTTMRRTPEITQDVTNGGLALTYAKFASTEQSYADFLNPTQMPFYFQPPYERPNPYINYFMEGTTDGMLSMAYQTAYTKNDAPTMGGGASLEAVKFQHVIMSKTFLDGKGLTADAVRNNYSYDQVMELVNGR